MTLISKGVETKFRSYLDKSEMAFHSYQLEGVLWCVNSEINPDPLYNNVRGGFIADEMGLGKTIMMIGTMICNRLKRTLIVVPVILIDQWFQQILKTTGHKAIIYHGNSKKGMSKNDLEKATIVITSYAHIAINKKKYKKGEIVLSTLHQIEWSRVVFDEAHHLRNSSTGRNIGSKHLKTDIIWLISGTPIQNTRKDFYHLCNTLGLPSFDQENISCIIERFILRRSKKEVGINCGELALLQEDVSWKKKNELFLSHDIHSYLSINKEIRASFNDLKDTDFTISPFENKKTLEIYLRAKQACILPSLMGKRLSGKDLWKSNYSSKIDSVVECVLSKNNNGNGKIIFCSYRFEMDTIARKLIDGGMEEEKIKVLDGRLRISERKKCLSELQLYSILIIQIQTGCEGLNLQEYFNEIYFVSPNWNPCVEDQAIARCYRLGQKKTVFVYKFMMNNNNNESDVLIDLMKGLNIDLIKNIIDYIPCCNWKWINMDEYIVSIQDVKREMIKEFL
jgi:SNF2 family DNA or RNA helicase